MYERWKTEGWMHKYELHQSKQAITLQSELLKDNVSCIN